MPYQIIFSRIAETHLQGLTARDRRIVIEEIVQQLTDQAAIATRNRKPMRPNPLASWELRVGNLRVYYDIEDEPEPLVEIIAVGVKERDRVRIGNKVVEL